MFWFKKKKIVLDCFTLDPFSYEFTPITPATHHYPDWFTSLPSKIQIHPDNDTNVERGEKFSNSMKHCRGITDMFRSSFTIPFWGQLKIVLNDQSSKGYFWQTSYTLPDQKIAVHNHFPTQFEGFLKGKYQNIKLQSPWKLKTNRYIKFLMTDATWCREELTNFTVLPGVLDFKYQSSTNVNLMVERLNTNRDIIFEAGAPIAMLTALTEDDVEIKLHLVTEMEMKRIMPFDRVDMPWASVASKYNRSKRFIDTRDQLNNSKCPFGFGK